MEPPKGNDSSKSDRQLSTYYLVVCLKSLFLPRPVLLIPNGREGERKQEAGRSLEELPHCPFCFLKEAEACRVYGYLYVPRKMLVLSLTPPGGLFLSSFSGFNV